MKSQKYKITRTQTIKKIKRERRSMSTKKIFGSVQFKEYVIKNNAR